MTKRHHQSYEEILFSTNSVSNLAAEAIVGRVGLQSLRDAGLLVVDRTAYLLVTRSAAMNVTGVLRAISSAIRTSQLDAVVMGGSRPTQTTPSTARRHRRQPCAAKRKTQGTRRRSKARTGRGRSSGA